MTKIAKVLAVAAIAGAVALPLQSANAWWGGGGPWGGGYPGGGGWGSPWETMGFGDLDMGLRTTGWGRSYSYPYGGYGYGPWGGGPYGGYPGGGWGGYPGAWGGGPGYWGGYGGGYPMAAPAYVAPAAPAQE